MNSKPTKEYLKALESAKPEIFGYGKWKRYKFTTIWIHKNLVIAFARWLSPEFAVWCDLQIEEILKSKNSTYKPIQTSEDFDIKSYTQKNRELINLVELVTSKNPITLFYLDKLTQKLNLKSSIDLLEIDLKLT